MESIVLRRLDFESQTTQCAFFLAAGLYPVAAQFHNNQRPSEFLEHFTDFERRFPRLDIPLYKDGLFRFAAYAAQNLGDNVAVQRYQAEADAAFAQCPYTAVGADGTAAVDHESESIEAEVIRENPSLWGKLAVTIVVRWIKAEVRQGLTTDQHARELLGMTGRNPTCQQITSSISNISDLLAAIDPSELAGELYGTSTPTPPEIWNPRFSRLEEWLRKDGYPPSTKARHRVLEMLQQMRVTSYREFMLKSGKGQDYETIKCVDFEVKKRLALHQSIHPAVAQIDACRFDVASSVFSLANAPRAVADGAVTDEMMVEALSVFEDVLSRCKGLENMHLTYLVLNQLSRAMWVRYYVFKSAPPTTVLPYLAEADKIYCEIRRERSISKPSNSVGTQEVLADGVQHDFIYGYALQTTLEAYRKPGHHSMVSVQTCTGDSLNAHLFDFLEWTQKSKARGLTDALGLEARLPSGMLAEAKQSSKASTLLEKEIQLVSEISIPGFEKNLHLSSQLRELRETMRAEPALDKIMRIRDGSSMTLSEIQMLGVELGPNVVFVDWIHVNSTNLVMVLYHNGLFQEEIILHTKLEDVERWVYEQLDVAIPLSDSSATSKLATIAGLIAPLEHYTRPGDTLVLSPTRILHRVPLHAIKLGNQPLIVRNPVVYTQSLSLLRLCNMSLKSNPPPIMTHQSATPPSFRAVVIHPLPNSWLSTNQVEELTANLGATALHGPRIDRSSFFATAANASLIHYHGHVSSNSQPLHRALNLDATSQNFSEATSVAVDAIFDLHLTKPALVTLIGCSSNHAPINQTDDLRSIPSAFHYAGASSVVSTLWPIRDTDGAKFSQAFYTSLGCQMKDMESSRERSSIGLQKRTLDLAKAIQEAVSVMMMDDEGIEREAYHWAGYVLNGVWRWEVPRGALANL
ncbi:hypothetical protein PILCRDRAFT_579510 [Piloderma croceum F 1598]|uniref:CHAT domain-containing protein n=1 Tax=Piloderma croceum (strain F 1598) TaxID=765440 RepID=A0A0C3FG07_PILCF|nr:hypothetical protein PILCRDRAFT_579510 [Piloderma croceum F 1598]